MFRFLMILILTACGVLCAGCSDDPTADGPAGAGPVSCADVAGTWSMALAVEGTWLGEVLSTMLDLSQSESCVVTGSMVLGPELLGYTTPDSLFFSYGEADAAPEDRIQCAVGIINEYLMEGHYDATEGSGPLTLVGPNPDCSGSVDLQVIIGLVLVIDWHPECAVSLVIIEPEDSGADQWFVGNENENAVNPHLAYGLAPVDVYSSEPIPLVAGQTYKVILYRWLGEEDSYLMVGYGLFTA